MADGKQRFILKAILAMVVIVGALTLISVSVEATTARFGKIGWIPWLIGFFTFAAGLLAAWATIISILDWRALKRYRADPSDIFSDGQTVALSGQVRVDGEPLAAPFSQKPCAAFSYQVTGQRRGGGSSTSQYRQQLCLLGYHLLPAELDTGSRSFPLMAIPDVDTDFRSTASGGEWGDQALEQIRTAAETWPRAGEADARGKLEDARKTASAPQSVDLYVSSTQTGAPQLGIQEDVVPVETTVTILGTYAAGAGALDGWGLGGMKVFLGELDERLGELAKEWRKGLKVALPLLVVGFGLLTMAWWWVG